MKTLLLLLTALTSLPAFAGGGSSVGVGNPAAKLCLDIGGKLERTRSRQGENANCVIEEWSLFRTMSERNLVQPYTCDRNIPCMANPASVNCVRSGGKLRIVEGRGGQYGMCAVEQWTLFRVFNPR